MPKLGGHTARMTDFLEQMTSMLGFTENLAGAWQLARKTGRLHTKVPFLVENQNQFEKNYFQIVCDVFAIEFIPYLTGDKVSGNLKYSDLKNLVFICEYQGFNQTFQPDPTNTDTDDKKKVRFVQSYSPQQITEVWKRFFTVVCGQLTEAFEIERQKGLNADNQKTMAPHQHAEDAEHKRKQLASVSFNYFLAPTFSSKSILKSIVLTSIRRTLCYKHLSFVFFQEKQSEQENPVNDRGTEEMFEDPF